MPAAHLEALRRLRRAPAPAPRAACCECCAEPLAEQHEHLLELATGELRCACTACALLFDRPGQPQRRLPRDARRLADFDPDPQTWAALDIPVKLAFITTHGDGSIEARYPSPGGTVRARLDPAAWAEAAGHHPALAAMQPELESLLINRLERPHLALIVPLDQGYRLAGLLRSLWTGFSGGPEVRTRVREFCAALGEGGRHA